MILPGTTKLPRTVRPEDAIVFIVLQRRPAVVFSEGSAASGNLPKVFFLTMPHVHC